MCQFSYGKYVWCTNYSVGIFHLFNHAFFKALLFPGGAMIHALANEQDIRKYGFQKYYYSVIH
jgi:NADH:ubiquinone oxidoreductase subunit 5 (subunit L)/multisubunit Na+/H+ antiporter MnhA subunit